MYPENALQTIDRVSSLTIDWSEWEIVRSKIKELRKLEHLTLNDVGTAEFPRELADLPPLKSLVLRVVGERLPSGIQVFSAVKKLEIVLLRADGSRPTLWELPEGLAAFVQLERLRVEYAGFDRFPTFVYDLPNLWQLSLQGGRIGQFPIGISKMKRLRWISWCDLAVGALPPDLGKLPALENLQLDGIALRAFSVEKGDYTMLQELTLKSCELSRLPDELGQLGRLRALDVSGNPLTEVPPTLAMAKNLEFLSASGCRVERITPEFFSLPALQRIDLTGNTFPRDECKALERLAKSHPKIEVLMPRSSAKKPGSGAAISKALLAKSIQKDLDRLGAGSDKSDEHPHEEEIAGTTWPIPPAIGELLARISSPRAILASAGDEELARVDLSYSPGDLDEHECIHHHPYVTIATTATHFYIVLRLDDAKPADPMLCIIDSEDYTTHEADKFMRLSVWLKSAQPADEKA